ncbi:hypothetical protein ABM698_000188 [Salmonella enterica subsp. enterica serovar Newport]|nr:hypothetical protein [Salmonella enterica subsp. enterica serovar Enteritidis]ECF3006336.1 hypothetical protein [Salmonella enterica subsp. enterica serovar Enteritidis]ECG1798688.1 hypothetical protein [Salmonella enterica subsp. enterica serovar Paratyphi B]ECG3268917.1 hypothetical protein [Salmonella enterica subsp. enterica serovar Infantis]EIP7032258.1 hypothetical protein [Salmonella enterica]
MGNQDKNKQQSSQQSTAEQSTVVETTGVSQDAARPELTSAVVADPQTIAPAGTINAEEQNDLKLLGQLLEEYSANSGMHVDLNSSKSKTAFTKLHHAFRLLFKQRGTAFKQAFALFVKSVVEAKTKAYHPKVVNYHLDNLNADEQTAFIVFINLVTRFARFDNKAKFAKNTNVSRLTELVSDPELKGLLDEVFLVKH